TDGRAILAVGSPFEAVMHKGHAHRFSQVNNFWIFPGLGAGAHLAQARCISEGMLLAAARAVHAALRPDELAAGLILPEPARLREVATQVAAAVMVAAAQQGLAGRALPADAAQFVREWRYVPHYQRYVPA
ncbi:MAG: malic enzyme-like NAD(P)-binding protein, partial [Armatimonadota bacterium]